MTDTPDDSDACVVRHVLLQAFRQSAEQLQLPPAAGLPALMAQIRPVRDGSLREPGGCRYRIYAAGSTSDRCASFTLRWERIGALTVLRCHGPILVTVH